MADQHELDPTARPYDPRNLPRKEPVGFEGFLALDLRVVGVVEVE